jgi:hypothetical protein
VVQRLLAEGDRARTYLATASNGLTVVVKEVLFDRAPSASAIEAFQRTTAALQQLQHPRIPRFISAFSEGIGVGMRLYLVQSFLPGESIEQNRRVRYGELEILKVAREVLSILKYLHEFSPPVVHGDVKVANLIRGPENTLWLVDFGLTRLVEETEGRGMSGAAASGYAPLGEPARIGDASTDLYALGATLLSLLTGKAPEQLLDRTFHLALPSHLPITLRMRAWLRCLIAPRGWRFLSAAEAEDALDFYGSLAAAGIRREASKSDPRLQAQASPALVGHGRPTRELPRAAARDSLRSQRTAAWVLGFGLPTLFAVAFYAARAVTAARTPATQELPSEAWGQSLLDGLPDVKFKIGGDEDADGCHSVRAPLRGHVTSGQSVLLNCSVAGGVELTEVCHRSKKQGRDGEAASLSLKLKTDSPVQSTACADGLKFVLTGPNYLVGPARTTQLSHNTVQVSFADVPDHNEIHMSSAEVGQDVSLTIDWERHELVLRDPG